MRREVQTFENKAGDVSIYLESSGVYTVERRICRMPGIYRCRVYECRERANAEERFDQMRQSLMALQTRRSQNTK